MIDFNQLVGLFLGLVIGIPIGRMVENYITKKKNIMELSHDKINKNKVLGESNKNETR